MPTVAIIAEDIQERDALMALLARAGLAAAAYADPPAFLKSERGAGCLLLQQTDPVGTVESLRRLRAGGEDAPEVVVLSAAAPVPLAVQAMKAGAADFLERPCEPSRLIDAVRAALEAYAARRKVVERKRRLIERYRSLSARERDVVGAVLGGSGNREVASLLGIKTRTVETHRSNAMSKMGARTLPELVRIWLDLDSGAQV